MTLSISPPPAFLWATQLLSLPVVAPADVHRHEVAYIFGQLCSPHSVPSLLHVLRDQKEDDMVRHEAAEALGGIASDAPSSEEKGEDVLAILREWAVKADAPVVVRESCQVAIDMWEVSLFLPFSVAYFMSLGVRSRGLHRLRMIGDFCEKLGGMLMDSTKTLPINSIHSINSKLRVT